MLTGIADTHTVIWYIFNDLRLSTTARTFMESSAAAGNNIGISSITLGEIVYLIEKRRIPVEAFTRLANEIGSKTAVFIEIPFDLRIARSMSAVDSSKVPDMPDRIIAATALNLGIPVISRDAKIQTPGINTIW